MDEVRVRAEERTAENDGVWKVSFLRMRWCTM